MTNPARVGIPSVTNLIWARNMATLDGEAKPWPRVKKRKKGRRGEGKRREKRAQNNNGHHH